jgi:hypothetical protein
LNSSQIMYNAEYNLKYQHLASQVLVTEFEQNILTFCGK